LRRLEQVLRRQALPISRHLPRRSRRTACRAGWRQRRGQVDVAKVPCRIGGG
jgi:hypothetical protein